MKRGNFLIGFLCGALMFGGATAAATTADIMAKPTWQTIYVDGQQVSMTAYNIAGNNFVKLRDIGQQVGFNVYWSDGVQIDTEADYTGEAPAVMETQVDTEKTRYEIVERTNAIRTEEKASALATDSLLMQAAQVRAEEMAATSNYTHTRPDGSRFYTVTDCPYMAENIHRVAERRLRESDLAELVVSEWTDSAGHLKNMLGDQYSSVGIGLAKGTNASGEDAWYCVQLFLYEGQSITRVDEPITSK